MHTDARISRNNNTIDVGRLVWNAFMSMKDKNEKETRKEAWSSLFEVPSALVRCLDIGFGKQIKIHESQCYLAETRDA